ncbi:MAG: NAD-dependent epimerase/dehydratase family protein [Rhodomicrobiaceae bacterium]
MRLLVTGAGGFIGRRLVKALLEKPALTRGEDQAEQIGEIILTSRSGDLAREFDDPRLTIKIGDIRNPSFLDGIFETQRIDSIFHLATALTAESEEDFEYGLQVNVLGLIRLLELCRAQHNRPRFVYASSIAAFGGRLPSRVDDRVVHYPQTSFGTAKAMGELLINDYSRHGYIDGRALRLPLVLARPAPVRLSVADSVGAVLREPLLGKTVVCPLNPESCVAVASVRNAALSLIQIHEIPGDRFGDTRAMNMPALTVTLAELADTVETYDFPGTRGLVRWDPDEELQAIVDGWPSVIVADEATRHNMHADASAAEILRNFIEDYEPRPGAPVELPQLRVVEGVR